MKFLPSFFKRRPKIDRLKALHDMFRFSRPEDIAKVYELGRIDMLHNVWLYSFFGFLAIFGTLVGIFEVFIETKIDSIIDSRVEKEIDKRIDKFSQFYAFTQDVVLY